MRFPSLATCFIFKEGKDTGWCPATFGSVAAMESTHTTDGTPTWHPLFYLFATSLVVLFSRHTAYMRLFFHVLLQHELILDRYVSVLHVNLFAPV